MQFFSQSLVLFAMKKHKTLQIFSQSLVPFAMEKHKTLQIFLPSLVPFAMEKHKTLQDFLQGMVLSAKKAQDSAGFAGVAPTKGGDAGKFSAAHRGPETTKLRHRPPLRGAMLSVLLHPLLGRCNKKISLSPPGPF